MIVTIANEKGGSGKSTLCLNLALKLMEANREVVVLDTDMQKSIEVFLNIRNEKELHSFPLYNRTGNITDTLKQMSAKYENILIDTKGEDSKECQKAMLLSDLVIIPTTPSQLDIAVLLEMFERIKNIQAINEKLRVCILMNRIPPIPYLKEKQALIDFISENKEDLNIDLLENVLHERIAYKRSVSEGLGVIEYDEPKAKKEFEGLYNELEIRFFKQSFSQDSKQKPA